MNHPHSPHPSPPVGERVPEGRGRGRPGSWSQCAILELWRLPLNRLLFRRLAVGRAPVTSRGRRLSICDTADCQSALQDHAGAWQTTGLLCSSGTPSNNSKSGGYFILARGVEPPLKPDGHRKLLRRARRGAFRERRRHPDLARLETTAATHQNVGRERTQRPHSADHFSLCALRSLAANAWAGCRMPLLRARRRALLFCSAGRLRSRARSMKGD